ncbi:hypothetical protein [Candidatus Methanoprimaticola sp. MG2]|uniref:hypothetical protein n=1 Tax=Candidatus Methanoprimaticola sp. MG2 TaxID=3228838 RepID=UPI0039C7613B
MGLPFSATSDHPSAGASTHREYTSGMSNRLSASETKRVLCSVNDDIVSSVMPSPRASMLSLPDISACCTAILSDSTWSILAPRERTISGFPSTSVTRNTIPSKDILLGLS